MADKYRYVADGIVRKGIVGYGRASHGWYFLKVSSQHGAEMEVNEHNHQSGDLIRRNVWRTQRKMKLLQKLNLQIW